jgi:hypothetical protein
MRTTNCLPIIALALSLGGSTVAAQDSRAEAVLNAARQALGGAEKLAAIQGVSAKGTHHRSMGEIQATGDTQIEVTLPDKYLRSQTDQIFGNSVTIETGFDGEEPVQRSNSVGGGPNVVFRMAGPGSPGAKADDPALLKANQLRAQRADFTRLMLGWFAIAPAFMEATYSYAGVAESPDGRADVIDVKGRDNFAAKLFIDQHTHRPLMLTYMGVKPVVRVMRTTGGGHGAPAPTGAEESSKRADQVARDASQEPPPLVEMQLYFDDYRQVGGVWLPHHISRSINGETNEEIEFQKFQVK